MSNKESGDELFKRITDGMERLREEGIKWVEANKSKRFSGVSKILTDSYPDNAHFIYELLQNAEDARDKTNPVSRGASVVRFTLTNDSLEFEHNGGGLFTLEDVSSITAIGDSNKPEDSTSIGKFGVGFKAVFAYTNTPEIHSGDFHFRIRDLVVPETKGVQHTRMEGLETRFIFPFDNPKKPREQAVDEVQRGLLALGNNTLLFLNHIHKIEYLLPNGSLGTLERIPHQEGRIEIRTTQPDGKETISHWLLFKKDVEVTDEKGEPKNCRIAIAYSLVKEENKKMAEKWKIVPLDHGQTSIYFPASEEKPNLKFHLHAPFASTVARANVSKGVKANEILRDRLSDLIVESLHNIRDQGMLTVGFLAVLPNRNDDLHEFYEPIRNAIVHAFQKQDLTPTRSGEHRSAETLYRGPAKIAEVLGDEGLSLLTNYATPLWAANAPQENQREDQFIQGLEIEEWGWSNLVSIFRLPHDYLWGSDEEDENHAYRERIETFIREMSDSKLMRFYALLGEAIFDPKKSEGNIDIHVGDLRIVRVSTSQGINQHVPINEAYFPLSADDDPPSDIFFVKPGVYSTGRSEQQKSFAKLFLDRIGVRVYDDQADIERILEQYDGRKIFPVKTHLRHIRQFIDYWLGNPHSIEMFQSIPFLMGQGGSKSNGYFDASKLYLDSPFMETRLGALFNDKNLPFSRPKQPLSTEYQSIKKFTEFAVKLGVMSQLEICTEEATAMQPKIFGKVGRKSEIDDDYFINGFGDYKNSNGFIGIFYFNNYKSMALSHAIWRLMCEADPKVLTARYKPNQKYSHKEVIDNSFLVHYLTKHKWVPDNAGNFLQPCQVTRETLHPDFKYDDRNGWLTAIKFGEDSKKQTEEYLAKDNEAKKLGLPSAEYLELCKQLFDSGIDIRKILEEKQQPEDSVRDPERRKRQALINAAEAPSNESIRTERTIQQGISTTTDQAKTFLRSKYTNLDNQLICQCCRKEMPFKLPKSDEYYFEAVQCIVEKEKRHFQTRLALCPICAAMYQYARETSDTEIQRCIIEHQADEKASFVEIPVRLAGREFMLRFVGTHWFDLKTILSEFY